MATKKPKLTGAVVRRLGLPGSMPAAVPKVPGLRKAVRSLSATPKQPTFPSASDQAARVAAANTKAAVRVSAVKPVTPAYRPPTKTRTGPVPLTPAQEAQRKRKAAM